LAKVYVSSTLADLAEERQAVLDWLRLARHQAVDSYVPDSGIVPLSGSTEGAPERGDLQLAADR
jgi:hypothetical protein